MTIKVYQDMNAAERAKAELSHYIDKPFREFQEEAIRYIQDSRKKYVFLEAPTGSGKSLIAMVSGVMAGGATYAVHSKVLQNQIVDDFPEARSLFGRANYSCIDDEDGIRSCDECHSTMSNPCEVKSRCKYEIQKRLVLASKLRILNYDYLLSEINYVGRFSYAKNKQLIGASIIDEADNLENTLVGFISLTFTEYALSRLNLLKEVELLKKSSKFSDQLISDWKDFCEDAKTRAMSILLRLNKEIEDLEKPFSHADIKLIKNRNRLVRLIERMDIFLRNVDDTWLYDTQDGRHTFRPLWLTEEIANHYLWQHSRKWVLLSATFLPVHLEAKRLGIPLDEVDYKCLQCTFPVERRQTYIENVASLTAKTMDKEVPKIIARVSQIVNERPNVKGLIHAVSYRLANQIYEGCKDDRLIIHNSKNRQEILEHFMNSDDPQVLISPSMERGVSLEQDLCRFIIVVKAPFLYLGDKIVSARVYSSILGKEWFDATMLASVLQMTGRGMRSADDYCENFILDEQFQRVMNKRPSYLPQWWREAIAF